MAVSCHNSTSESSDIISLVSCTAVDRYQLSTSESAGHRHGTGEHNLKDNNDQVVIINN